MSIEAGDAVIIVQRDVSPMASVIQSLGTEVRFTSPEIITVRTRVALEKGAEKLQVEVLQYFPAKSPIIIRGKVL